MEKTCYFPSCDEDRWPRPEEIKHYFIAPPGRGWFFETKANSGGFDAKGVDGTEHLPLNERTNISLSFVTDQTEGVMLLWSKQKNREHQYYNSKGDLSRLRELVLTRDGDLFPVGLFVPFEEAWKAVKEFLENGGQLPKSIAWVSNDDLPPDTFPDPGSDTWDERLAEFRRQNQRG